jgi:hypothetical protein
MPYQSSRGLDSTPHATEYSAIQFFVPQYTVARIPHIIPKIVIALPPGLITICRAAVAKNMPNAGEKEHPLALVGKCVHAGREVDRV